MTQSKLMLIAAAAALTLGVSGNTSTPIGRQSGFSDSNVLIAGDETTSGTSQTEKNAQGSAKMGSEKGTHTGPGQGATPQSDTQKIDQPSRRNTPSGDDSPD